MMSSSIPLTPSTMTRGFGFGAFCCCAKTGTASKETDSNKENFFETKEHP
jgi:hypothetical protein